MRLAFQGAGGECVFSSEWDKYSRITYESNFGEAPFGDITQIDEKGIPKFDFLLAGFPCQPFSTIGRRQGFNHPTQGTLFHEIIRVMKHHRNRGFLLENVVGLKSHDGGRTLQVIEDALTSLNYQYDYRILDAANFGVPQHRSRIYIVGHQRQRGGRIEMDWPSGNKVPEPIGPHLKTGVLNHSISQHLQNSYLFKNDDGRPQIVDQSSNFPVKTLVASYHKIQRLTGTFVRDGETGIRLLTSDECKAIMGLPSDFKFPVSRTQMYRQIGNSVAVPVVSALAKWMTKDT